MYIDDSVTIHILTSGDYEDSKRYEVFRRYRLLKGIIKRAVMYTKLEVLPNISTALGISSLATMTAPGIRRPVGRQPLTLNFDYCASLVTTYNISTINSYRIHL